VFYSPAAALEPPVSLLVVALVLSISFLMVSKLRYLSVKTIDIRQRMPYSAILIGVAVLYLLIIHPPLIILAISTAYALSGILMKLFSLVYKREKLPLRETGR
jgi:CDP-diacylglycerol--serine O-phosphatidyltransferase